MAFLIRSRRRFASNQKQNRPFTSKAADAFCLILGFSTLFSIRFVGDLYVAEILLAIVLPVLLIMRGRRAARRELKLVYIMGSLWLCGLVISDAYNQTPYIDRLRGVALIVFFGFNIIGMSVLVGSNDKRKLIYLIGLMIGALAWVKLQPNEATEQYPWKFGYAWGSMQLAMLVSSYFYGKRRYVISALVVLAICGVNVMMNFRSPILLLLLTVSLVYPIIPENAGSIRILPRSRGMQLAILAVFALGAAATADQLVKFVTRAGYIGEDAQAKNEAQEKAGNLLLGGRPEFVIGIRAALDSPFVGHGSWPKDLKYFEMLYDTMVENGAVEYDKNFDAEANGLIPSHSHIVGAWVWAGIAGLFFWLYMIWFVGKGMAQLALQRPPLAPAYMWLSLSFFWDIFFSPFAANRRIVEAFLIVVIADLMERRVAVVEKPWRRLGATGRRVAPVPSTGGPLAPIRPR